MACENELLRWKTIYEHLVDRQVDLHTICRIWPSLTRIPLKFPMKRSEFHRTVDSLAKGEA